MTLVDGPLIVDVESDGSGLEAEISGVISLDEGCLTLGPDGLGVVWPPGTTWDEAGETALLADGRAVGSGDSISGGGGYFGSDDGTWVGEESRESLERCGIQSVAVLNFDPADIVLEPKD